MKIYSFKKFFYKKIIFSIVVLFFIFAFAGTVYAFWGHMDTKDTGYEILHNNSVDELKIKVEIYDDKPKLVWQTDLGAQYWGDIYYTQWSGTEWTKADGTSGYDNLTVSSGGNHDEPYIELDSAGNPKIIFRDKNLGKIIYTQWSPNACGGSGCWTKADGTTSSPSYDTIGVSDAVLDFALDSNDNPHIIWRYNDGGGMDVYYTKWNGSNWTYADGTTLGEEKIDLNGGAIICHIEIYNDKPIIITDDSITGNSEIQYIQWSGSAWTNADGITVGWENISNTATNSARSRFKIDSLGNIKVVWTEETASDNEIYYTQWTVSHNDWTKADGITSGWENVSDNSGDSSIYGINTIMLDNNDNPGLVWLDDTSGNSNLYYSQYVSGTGWTKADGSTLGCDNVSDSSGDKKLVRMAFDSTNNPNIVWGDDFSGNYEVYFSQYVDSVGWTEADKTTVGKENISNTSGTSSVQSILLNSINEPHVFWYDDTDGDDDVYFSRWTETNIGQVNITADVEPSLSLTLPGGQTANLGYFSSQSLQTAVYQSVISTNGSLGYTAYIKDDGDLRNETNSVSDTSGTISYGDESYGVVTTEGDTVDITKIIDTNNDEQYNSTDCTLLDGEATSLSATALTSGLQSFAKSNGPVSDDNVYLCFIVAISGSTPAGAYSSTATITVVGNF